MSTIIRTSSNSKTGYELVVDGDVVAIDSTYKEEPKTLVLPTNPTGRKYFNSDKVDKADGQQLELTIKEPKQIGPRTATSTKQSKPLADYLSDEPITVSITFDGGDTKTETTSLKALYTMLNDKAIAAKTEANKPKPMTELETAEAAYKKALAKVEALKAAALPAAALTAAVLPELPEADLTELPEADLTELDEANS